MFAKVCDVHDETVGVGVISEDYKVFSFYHVTEILYFKVRHQQFFIGGLLGLVYTKIDITLSFFLTPPAAKFEVS